MKTFKISIRIHNSILKRKKVWSLVLKYLISLLKLIAVLHFKINQIKIYHVLTVEFQLLFKIQNVK